MSSPSHSNSKAPSQERPSAQIITTPSSNRTNDVSSTNYYQPGYFANRGASRSSAERNRSIEQQHTLEMEEMKIKLQQEKSKVAHAEEAIIRKDKELDRMREDLERYQREALKSGTNAASLEAELTATKVQLSEALSSRDGAVKNYRELQTLHRQVEASREEAMNQLNELTHELELVRRGADEKSLPLTQMLSQLTNRLATIEEKRQQQSAARSRSKSSSSDTDSSPTTRLREMQQSIVSEALNRYDASSQNKQQANTHAQAMLEESEKIKNILKEQLETAQSQIAQLETKFRAAAEFTQKNKQHLEQRKWLLLQRKWLAQLLREYDVCFRQFPTVLPWFRMPQRKSLRVYVWTVIAALRLVKGPSCLSDKLPQIKRFFAISAAKCSPAAVFRKIHQEIDHLNGNTSGSISNHQESPLAHLPVGQAGTMVFHSSGNTIHHQQQHQRNNNSHATASAAGSGSGAGGRNFVFPSTTNTNNNNSSGIIDESYHHHHHHLHANSSNSNNNNYSMASTTSSSSGINVDPDDITAILGEIHNIDSRITRALRAHGDHVVTISDRHQYPHFHQRFGSMNTSRSDVQGGGGNASVLSTNNSQNHHHPNSSMYSSGSGGNNSSTMIMFAP